MKPIYILGISAFYHDAAAALLRNGEIVAAAQEERFTRKKHDYNFPQNSIDYCLSEAGIAVTDLGYIAFYDKPFIKFERLISTYLSYAPAGIGSFILSMPLWLKRKLFIRNLIEDKLRCCAKVLFAEHHQSHAASAFYPSPFKEAAFLTMDGVGEWATAAFGVGRGNKLEITRQLLFPHSLGLLYSTFTYYAGFKINSGEYKLMGLAPYGEPAYVDIIKEKLIDIKKDGSFRINLKYFNFCAGLTMTNSKFHRLFGGSPRKPDVDRIEQRHMDIARSIQVVTEEIILKTARYIYNETGKKNLCMAGGVALNCVANARLLREGPFENIWVQPASTDAGGALGAALLVWHDYLKKERLPSKQSDSMKAALLGPAFSDEEIEDYLNENNIVYEKLKKEEVVKCASRLISNQKVLGWFQGRMEYGPRALGNRSILADPRSGDMRNIINLKIKFRESFRPFAPTVLADRVSEYFDFDRESPYMLFTAPVKKTKRLPAGEDETDLSGLSKLNIRRSIIPAVTHVDYSARIQTLKREDNPLYCDVINEFFNLTGCALVINTSFNVEGEPMVCTPGDAYRCFMRTDMDYLIMGSFLLDKDKQRVSNDGVDDLNEFKPTKLFKLLRVIFTEVTRAISRLNTALLLSIIFYLLIMPIGLITRLLKSDPLERRIEKNKDSYWLKKEPAQEDSARYEKSF